MTRDNAAYRTTMLQAMREMDQSDEQIIEMLLGILDDWEVRKVVTECRHRRQDTQSSQTTGDERITQTVTTSRHDKKPNP